MIPSGITEDLRNGMGLEECLVKHNTNLKMLFNTSYPNERRFCPEWRYIEKRGLRFYIKKKIKFKTYYFGIYSCLEDAQRVRDELIKIGWKQDQVDSICEKVGIERIPGKNEHRFEGTA